MSLCMHSKELVNWLNGIYSDIEVTDIWYSLMFRLASSEPETRLNRKVFRKAHPLSLLWQYIVAMLRRQHIHTHPKAEIQLDGLWMKDAMKNPGAEIIARRGWSGEIEPVDSIRRLGRWKRERKRERRRRLRGRERRRRQTDRFKSRQTHWWRVEEHTAVNSVEHCFSKHIHRRWNLKTFKMREKEKTSEPNWNKWCENKLRLFFGFEFVKEKNALMLLWWPMVMMNTGSLWSTSNNAFS